MPPARDAAQVIAFDQFEADLRTGELRRNGSRLRIQEKPFQILAILSQRPGELVTREELRSRLWPADTFVDFDHGLNTAVNKLREALRDSASDPRYVQTIPRRGYRWLYPVTVVEPSAKDPASVPNSAADSQASAPSPAGAVTTSHRHELPHAPRAVIRTLVLLLQVMYVIFYVLALHNFHRLHLYLESNFTGNVPLFLLTLIVVTALSGIPVRLYLSSAVLFDYALLWEKFRRLSPFVFVLDVLWALSPLLAIPTLGPGICIANIAALVYAPFAQRTLFEIGWRHKIANSRQAAS